MGRSAKVQDLYDTMGPITNGAFRLGPLPDETHHCGHRWGNHTLLLRGANSHALDGGTWVCEDGCPCVGTWDAPLDPEKKADLKHRLDDKTRRDAKKRDQ